MLFRPDTTYGPAILIKKGWRTWQGVCGILCLLLLLPLTWQCMEREKIWQNSVTLWDYTVLHTPSNWARYNLTDSLLKQAKVQEDTGDTDGALRSYHRLLSINPENEPALLNIGTIY